MANKPKAEEPKYVNAPISIFRDFQTNPVETLSTFFDVGIYRFADAINYKMVDVLRSIIIDFNCDNLPAEVKKAIGGIAANNDIDTAEFDDWIFDLDTAIETLEEEFKELDGFILNAAVMFYRLQQAQKLLGITFRHTYIINIYKDFNSKNSLFTNKYGKDANVSLTINMLFDFIKEPKSKYEFDLLAAYVAVKSIQGNKQFCKTNKSFLLMRMLGAKSKQVLTDFLKIKNNKDFFEKYSKRYNIDKILNDLVHRGFIKSKIGVAMGIYISTHLSYDLLPIAIDESQKPNTLKANENNARERLKALSQHIK